MKQAYTPEFCPVCGASGCKFKFSKCNAKLCNTNEFDISRLTKAIKKIIMIK